MRSHSRAHCELIVLISEFGARVRSTPSAGGSCDMAGRSLQFGEVSQTQPVQFRWDGAQWRGTAFSVSQNVPWNVPALPVAPNAPPSAGALQAAAGGTLTALQPGRRAQVAAQSSQPVVAVPVPLVVGACASMSGANSARAGPPMLQSGVTNVAAPPPGATTHPGAASVTGMPSVTAGPTAQDCFEQELQYCLNVAPRMEPAQSVQEGVRALRALPIGVACSLMMRYQWETDSDGYRRWFGIWAVQRSEVWQRRWRATLADAAGA